MSFGRTERGGGGGEAKAEKRAKIAMTMMTATTMDDGTFESSNSRRGGERRRRRGGVMTMVMVLIVAWCVGVMVGGNEGERGRRGGRRDVRRGGGGTRQRGAVALYFEELTNTTYFRLFQVDLKRTCKFWGRNEERGDAGGERRRAACSAPIAVSGRSLPTEFGDV